MAPMHLEHHPWKLHMAGTQTWVHPWNPVLLKSKVRQTVGRPATSQILSALPTLTVVTIHNLACFLLVAFLTKLVRLVISVWICYRLQTLHANKHTLLLCSLFYLNSFNAYRLHFVQSKINYTENQLLCRCTVTQVDSWSSFTALLKCTEMY